MVTIGCRHSSRKQLKAITGVIRGRPDCYSVTGMAASACRAIRGTCQCLLRCKLLHAGGVCCGCQILFLVLMPSRLIELIGDS